LGVVEAVDASTGRVTIAYQPIQAFNWPAGTQPFQVSKSKLLEGIRVGDKVGFRMESQQITQMQVVGAKSSGEAWKSPPPTDPPLSKSNDDLVRAVRLSPGP